MNIISEPLRQPSKIALSAGRHFQSPNTGFVHYCYETSETEHDTIPVVDNFLWVLTLLRTHQSDQMREGFRLLERLLSYVQNGNFPRYLHEAPFCKDPFLAAHLLAPIFRMLTGYRKVMEEDLRNQLEQVAQSLVDYTLNLYKKQGAPYLLAVKIGAGTAAFGSEEGWKILEEQREMGMTDSWFAPDHLGDLLVSLFLLYENLEESPWKALWTHVSNTWYRPTLSYIGPALRQRQRRSEPQSTIYDLFLGSLTHQYSNRSFQIHPYQLQAALLFSLKQELPEHPLPFAAGGTYQGRPWKVLHMPSFGYGIIEQTTQIERSQQYRHLPFQLHWGDSNRVHTFCLQGGNIEKLRLESSEANRISLEMEVDQFEDKEKDLAFFVDRYEYLKKSVEEKVATTFELGERVRLEGGGLAIDMTMTAESQKGRYLGHLRPGTRPSQMCRKGKDRFVAYDEEIALRNIERKGKETLRVVLHIDA